MTRFTPSWRQADSGRKSSSKSNPRQQWRGDRLLNLAFKSLLYIGLPAVLTFTGYAVWASGAGKWEFPGCGGRCGKVASKRSCYACCRVSCNGLDRIKCLKVCDDQWGYGDGDQ